MFFGFDLELFNKKKEQIDIFYCVIIMKTASVAGSGEYESPLSRTYQPGQI
jgi:hypothetical protein